MRTLLIILLSLAMGAAGWYLGRRTSDREVSPPAATSSTGLPQAQASPVRGIGKLEPQSGVISVFAPTGQRIDETFGLGIGDAVARDQPLFKLGGREQREMELQIARAKKKDALNQLEYEKSKGRLQQQAAELALAEANTANQKIASKKKSIRLLKAQQQAANSQQRRLQSLRDNQLTRRLVGDADLEKQRLLVEQLATQISQAEDEVAMAVEQAIRAREAASIDLQTVEFVISESDSAVPLNSLNEAITAAETALALTEIKSPIDGTVLDIVVQPGDTATNRPVMLLGDTTTMVCVAEINDSRLDEVTVGDPATITSLAFDTPLQGTVVAKGIMISPPSLKDPNPFGSVDRRTGQVVINLESSTIARNFVNLQVEVEIQTRKRTDGKPSPESVGDRQSR